MSPRRGADRPDTVVIGLNACVISMLNDMPCVLVVPQGSRGDGVEGLPFGPFAPQQHRTLEIGLRSLVQDQTHVSLGYVEQLYTFGDRGRHDLVPGEDARVVSVGYLALTRLAPGAERSGRWYGIYDFFPWEDWRREKPVTIETLIRPYLEAWAEQEDADTRWERARLCFGLDGGHWDEEKVLERYELMYEAGLVPEARRDGRPLPASAPPPAVQARFGKPMQFDHRRILATGMGRIRGKLKYRPIVFELMDTTFTLLDLQRTVEAISGIRLHKQNFRRLVENAGLVERTGKRTAKAGGRPAEEFRFRREVLRERPTPGVRVPLLRTARP